MSCRVCNMKLEPNDRSLQTDPVWFPDEIWMVDYDEEDKEYIIKVSYDSGYASLTIPNINYCPKCGRRLGGE